MHTITDYIGSNGINGKILRSNLNLQWENTNLSLANQGQEEVHSFSVKPFCNED